MKYLHKLAPAAEHILFAAALLPTFVLVVAAALSLAKIGGGG